MAPVGPASPRREPRLGGARARARAWLAALAGSCLLGHPLVGCEAEWDGAVSPAERHSATSDPERATPPTGSATQGNATDTADRPSADRPPPELERPTLASAPNEACRAPGWTRAPQLRAGCHGVCVPDDVAARAPELSFVPRADLCEGCLMLATPWAKTEEQKKAAVGGHLYASGAAPDWFKLGLYTEEGPLIAVYDTHGAPQLAFLIDTDQQCGRVSSLKFSADGAVGVHLLARPGEPHTFTSSPAIEPSKLMLGSSDTLRWPVELTGELGINDMWFSVSLIAVDLSGSLVLGNRATLQTLRVAEHESAPPGGYYRAALSGDVAFVSRWDGEKTEYWVYDGDALRLFRGASDRDVRELVTDGKVLVWKEGRNPNSSPGAALGTVFETYDLYHAPFTSNPSELRPELLVADVPADLSWLALAGGQVAGIYLISKPVYRAAALVARLADGRALRAVLPNGYSWGFQVHPARTELWGAGTAGPMKQFESVFRVPYSAMEDYQPDPE